MQRNNTTRGIICLVFSSFCFALMGMFVHMAGNVPFIQKTFFRNIIAFCIAFALLLGEQRRTHTAFVLPHGSFKYLLMRSAAGSLGIFGNFYALDRINIADASILNKMSPFFAVLFSFFLLGEKIDFIPLCAVFGAFGGALLVIKPTSHILSQLPAIAGFVGGMGAGFAYACVRKMSSMKVNGSLIVAFFSAFSCLLAVPFMITSYSPMSPQQLFFLLAAGVAAAGGQFGITAAYYAAPAAQISIYDYSQILFSSFLGFAAFGQIPDLPSLCGYIVIIAMAVISFMYNRRKAAMA